MIPEGPGGRRRAWVRILGTALGLLLLVYLIRQQSWPEIAAALSRIPGWAFGLAVVLALLSRLAVVARWRVLLHGAGVAIAWREAARLTFAGLFASNFLPTTIGGDVVRLGGALRLGGPPATYAASIAVDRLVGMAGMLTAAPLGLPTFITWWHARPSGDLGRLSVVGVAAWPSTLQRWISKAVRGLIEALGLWRKNPRWLLAALGCTWVYMLLKFGALALFFAMLGEPIPLTDVAGLWSLVYFITLIPISIGGLGLQEVSASLIYSQVGGASLSAALAAALLLRTVEVLASLPGALFVSDILAGQRGAAGTDGARGAESGTPSAST
ncbi:MAG: flippase-like domain-containing protein [Anaerolineales bacterium]|nr:flippase-like domain-containing protein [Anaerolineales bacterium]